MTLPKGWYLPFYKPKEEVIIPVDIVKELYPEYDLVYGTLYFVPQSFPFTMMINDKEHVIKDNPINCFNSLPPIPSTNLYSIDWRPRGRNYLSVGFAFSRTTPVTSIGLTFPKDSVNQFRYQFRLRHKRNKREKTETTNVFVNLNHRSIIMSIK